MSHIAETTCPQCLAKFSHPDALAKHYSITHTPAGPSSPGPRGSFPCRHCGESKNTIAGLTKHIRQTELCSARQDAWLNHQIELYRGGSAGPTLHQGVRGSSSQDENSVIGSRSNTEQNQPENDEWEGHSEGLQDEEPMGAPSDEDESVVEPEEDEDDSDVDSYGEMEDLQYADDTIPSPSIPPSPSDHGAQRQGPLNVYEEVDQHGHKVYAEEYPLPGAGKPIRPATDEESRRGNYPDVGHLSDRDSFKIAQVLMESGMSAGYRNKYLRLKRVRSQMPWPNNRAMVKDIDKLPRGAGWTVQALAIGGSEGVEIVEMWMRDALEVVKQLLRNKRLGQFMQWRPIRKYTSPDGAERVRDEIYTADWMWEIQGEIKDENGTVIPIIISSDETKLTSFSGDKKAHPVYLTIGNLPKRLRRRTSKRANILLGYLPVPKLNCEANAEQRRYHRRNMFHTCLRALMKPLADACKTGVEVPCADGNIRRIYPVLAAYIADFPEQCKIACIKQTHCPLCTVHPKKKGDPNDSPPRTRKGFVEALNNHRKQGSAQFERLGLYDVDPFWTDYPLVRVDCLLTPDLLHQLHKGVMKDHLTKWVTQILGKKKIDDRHITMPEYHGMRHFKNGISTVSQWTGRELKEMAKVLLPIISDAEDPRVISAARSLLDFMYLAHSSSLTDSEIQAMERALRTFHANKAVFRDVDALRTQEGFHGIPKLHMIQHYAMLIRMLGAPDGYNTETSERLHIDFAKLGYRASNKVNAIKQMALYIQRMEAIAMHEEYLAETSQTRPSAPERVADEAELDGDDQWDEWDDQEEEEEDPDELADAGVRVNLAIELDEFLAGSRDRVGGRWQAEPGVPNEPADQGPQRFHSYPESVLAKTPTNLPTIEGLQRVNHAPQLHHSLQLYLRRLPSSPGTEALRKAVPLTLKVGSWSRARLFHSPPPFKPSEGPHIDVVRAQPVRIDQFQRVSRPARFDTVLVRNSGDVGAKGIHRYRPARVRAIFQLPTRLRTLCPDVLAYVELFNPTSQRPNSPTGLFTTTRSITDGNRSTAVIPLSSIAMTCHLTPRYHLFRPNAALNQHSDLLQLCDNFFVNIFATYFFYELLRHWGQDGSAT